MDYYDVFQRNIGLFTVEEQEKLRNAKVAIAGAGGVGGIQAATLARFGIGEISLLDPGVFDEPDMNRQFGAKKSTLGRNKAEATAEILEDMNPFLTVNPYTTPCDGKGELEAFIADSNLAIDAIDYMGFDYKVQFSRCAREQNIYNLSAPIRDFASALTIFDPKGMTFEEFHNAPEDPNQWPQHYMDPKRMLGKRHYPKSMEDLFFGKVNYISTNAGAATLNGGLLATEAVFILTGKRSTQDIVMVPQITYVDLYKRVYEIFNPLEEK